MKYIFLFGLLLTGTFVSAQEKAPLSTIPSETPISFSFDSLSFSKEPAALRTMIGNVQYKSPEFSFEKAEKVEVDPVTGKMLVYGCRSFSFSGKLVMEEGKGTPVLEYTPGQQELYLKRK